MATDGKVWDVCVIGGGPAGMMAAGRAAELGERVVLLEKNTSLGKKLLITGGGRCNVTNATFDTRTLLQAYKDAAKFLASPFSRWSVRESLDFFHTRGVPTKVEDRGRIFPVSDSARSVWDALVDYLRVGGVTVRGKSAVAGFVIADGRIVAVRLRGGGEVRAQSFILATGGLSHPETGSTGDGFKWLSKIGHTVREPRAALVPVRADEPWIKRLAGVSVRDVKVTVFEGKTKHDVRTGTVLFTHTGLSGPAILNASAKIGELLEYGEVRVEMDVVPILDYGTLDARLQKLLKEHQMKRVRNALDVLVPSALAPVAVELAGIPADTPCNAVSRAQRIALGKVLKHLTVRPMGLLGLDKAVIASGGVAREEVDWKHMRSTKYDNLYLVGDILDIDRPSGGYSLQLCWTTGHVAGTSAAAIPASRS